VQLGAPLSSKKRFPDEKQYRHTLKEETEALRTAASLIEVGSKKKSKEVASDADIALLKRLYDTMRK
jgi:hypothetical protein